MPEKILGHAECLDCRHQLCLRVTFLCGTTNFGRWSFGRTCINVDEPASFIAPVRSKTNENLIGVGRPLLQM
jgi:hypothetical protein